MPVDAVAVGLRTRVPRLGALAVVGGRRGAELIITDRGGEDIVVGCIEGLVVGGVGFVVGRDVVVAVGGRRQISVCWAC